MLDDLHVRRAAALYGLHCTRWRHIAGGANNTSFRIDTIENSFVLTVVDNTGGLSLEKHAQLLEHLGDNGVRVARPFPSLAGPYEAELDGRGLMMKQFVSGECGTELPGEHLEAAGATLARIHLAPLPSWLPRHTRRLDGSRHLLSQFEDRSFARWVTKQVEASSQHLRTAYDEVIVHGDFFPDNVIVASDGQLVTLDWEYASADSPVLDLGFAMTGLCRKGASFVPAYALRLLAGYQSVRPLPEHALASLQSSTMHAATALAFHRYVRHHLDHQDADRFDWHEEMVCFAGDVARNWRDLR